MSVFQAARNYIRICFFCVFFLDLGYVKAEAVPPPKKPLTLVPTHILVESQNFSTQPPF